MIVDGRDEDERLEIDTQLGDSAAARERNKRRIEAVQDMGGEVLA